MKSACAWLVLAVPIVLGCARVPDDLTQRALMTDVVAGDLAGVWSIAECSLREMKRCCPSEAHTNRMDHCLVLKSDMTGMFSGYGEYRTDTLEGRRYRRSMRVAWKLDDGLKRSGKLFRDLFDDSWTYRYVLVLKSEDGKPWYRYLGRMGDRVVIWQQVLTNPDYDTLYGCVPIVYERTSMLVNVASGFGSNAGEASGVPGSGPALDNQLSGVGK